MGFARFEVFDPPSSGAFDDLLVTPKMGFWGITTPEDFRVGEAL